MQRKLLITLCIFSFNFCVYPQLNSSPQLNISKDIYIDTGASMYIDLPNTEFNQGNIITDRSNINYGTVAFGPNAKWSNASHNAHVNGFIRMYNEQDFIFPSGHDQIFQPLHLKRIDRHSLVDVAYNHKAHENLTSEKGIVKVSDEFYWTAFGSNPAYVSLSWNSFSNIDKLVDNKIDNLSIVGYDGSVWRIIEAEIDPANFEDRTSSSFLSGSITSKNPVFLEGYEAFTLAAVSKIVINVSQGFTPNGDGINDTWHIENIEDFPNASIHVLSRWDRKVFTSLGNYKNDWDGTYNNKSEPVPDGSYAYIIDLEGDGEMDISGWIYITR